MRLQVNTDDRQLHVRYYETPYEVSAQPQVQAP